MGVIEHNKSDAINDRWLVFRFTLVGKCDDVVWYQGHIKLIFCADERSEHEKRNLVWNSKQFHKGWDLCVNVIPNTDFGDCSGQGKTLNSRKHNYI